MQGTISFHPIDPAFFDEVIKPLLLGRKVNPESWVQDTLRHQRAQWSARRYVCNLELLLENLAPPPPPEDGSLWDKVRTRLERLDYRPERASVIAANKLDPDLHLQGRPFFITEGSAARVSDAVDRYLDAGDAATADMLVQEQLAKLDAELSKQVRIDESRAAPPDLVVRREMLEELKGIFDLARAAEKNAAWGERNGPKRPAKEVLHEEAPWRSVMLASRAMPFWVAHDVDGLETMCRSAGVEVPDFIIPPWRLFADANEHFPGFGESLRTEMTSERDVGAYVAPENVPELEEFLATEGSRIIQVATQAGVGSTCTTLLRKIRECVRFARSRDLGYLEAAGIPPIVAAD